MRMQLIMSAVLIVATVTLAADKSADVIAWEDLHPTAQAFFEREAEQFIAIDGALWSRELITRYQRVARVQKALAPAWLQDDAPLLYNLATGDRHGPWGRPEERVIEYDAVMLQFQAHRNTDAGIVPLQGRVTRLVSDGAMIDLGRRTVFVAGVEDARPNESIVVWGKRQGYHYYVDSTRTRRSVDRYVAAEPDLAQVDEAVTGKQLYEYCITHQIEGIPFFVPERAKNRGDEFTWRETHRWTRIMRK